MKLVHKQNVLSVICFRSKFAPKVGVASLIVYNNKAPNQHVTATANIRNTKK